MTEPQNPPPSQGEVEHALTQMVRLLVDDAEHVEVRAVAGTQIVVFEVKVAPADIRHLVGRRGKTATALRELLFKMGSKMGQRYGMDIVEPRGHITVSLDSSH